MIARELAVRRTTAAARAGFTLMEVLVVVAILVVLAGVGVGVYMGYLEDARRSTAKLKITTIETAVQAYKINQGDWPADLNVLTQPLDGKAAQLEADALIDPWGRPFVYEPTNLHPLTGKPLIYSQGSNLGDPNSQIRNWSTVGQ